MSEVHNQQNLESDQSSILEEVKRLAKAGDVLSAVRLYRQIFRDVGFKKARDTILELAGLPPIIKQTPSIILSPETRRRLEILFQEDLRAEATKLIFDECGNNLPYLDKCDEFELERFRFAALKLSEGSLPRLHEAVELAKLDWRDLLVVADFANDTRAHERWNPTPK